MEQEEQAPEEQQEDQGPAADLNEILEDLGRQNGQQAKEIAILRAQISALRRERVGHLKAIEQMQEQLKNRAQRRAKK